MLRGIDPLLTPDLLHALAAMGHGDRIAIVDANYPAHAHARRVITLAGVDATAVLRAVLSLLPLDNFVEDPAVTMAVVGDASVLPDAVAAFITVLAEHKAEAPAASIASASTRSPGTALRSYRPASGASTAMSS